ncbi:MAG: hypothetical protein E7331_06015 [Clostridiales bacterium]|nr:hypothetical protein [Clostridiales bacterium]
MKKVSLLLAALLVVLCMMPAASLAENLIFGDIDGEVLDFDAFTLTLSNGDICQMGEKQHGALWATIYPEYDPSSQTHPNMNIIWSMLPLLPELPDNEADMQAFSATTAEDTAAQVAEMGIPCTVISATVLDNMVINGVEFRGIQHISNWDYTEYSQGAIGEMQLTTTQFFADFPEGGYVFTLTSYDVPHMNAMMEILETIMPKN